MTTKPAHSTHMERYNVDLEANDRGVVRGRAMPYGIPDGRPGRLWRIGDDGYPEMVQYAATVYEPGAFSSWLDNGGMDRVRFLYQHGDVGQGWIDAPGGVNSLPIGTMTAITELEDGVHFEAEFASHQLAQAVRELSQSGGLKELSVALSIRDFDIRQSSDDAPLIRYVSTADLLDVSVVVWGQFGLNAAITEVYSRSVETYFGATISKATRERLDATIDGLRNIAGSITSYADDLAELAASDSTGEDESSDDDDSDDDERNAGDPLADLTQRIHFAERNI